MTALGAARMVAASQTPQFRVGNTKGEVSSHPTSTASTFADGLDVTLSAGAAEQNFTCLRATDPGCGGTIRVTAKWSNSPVTFSSTGGSFNAVTNVSLIGQPGTVVLDTRRIIYAIPPQSREARSLVAK